MSRLQQARGSTDLTGWMNLSNFRSVNPCSGLQGLNGIKKIAGSSSNVIIREQTGLRRVFNFQTRLLIG